MCPCLRSQTCDCDLNWKTGFCRCAQVNDLERRSSWVIWVALSLVAGVLIRKYTRGRPRRRGEALGHRAEAAAMWPKPRTPEPLEAGRDKGRTLPGTPGASTVPLPPWSQTRGLQNRQRTYFYCLSHQGLMIYYGSTGNQFIHPSIHLLTCLT